MEQEALLAEYSTLRSELIQSFQGIYQVSAITVPVAIGFAAYGFQEKLSIAFIAVVAILIGNLWYNAFNTASIDSIASYIYAILEPKVPGLQWESLVTKRKSAKPGSLRYSTLTNVIAYLLLIIICLFVSWQFIDHNFQNVLSFSSTAISLLVIYTFVSINAYTISSPQYYLRAAKRWTEAVNSVNIERS